MYCSVISHYNASDYITPPFKRKKKHIAALIFHLLDKRDKNCLFNSKGHFHNIFQLLRIRNRKWNRPMGRTGGVSVMEEPQFPTLSWAQAGGRNEATFFNPSLFCVICLKYPPTAFKGNKIS